MLPMLPTPIWPAQTAGPTLPTVTTTAWTYTLTTDDVTQLLTFAFVNKFGALQQPPGYATVMLTAIATDEAGNTGVSPGHDIIVDITPPSARLSFTDVIESVDGTSVELSGTSSQYLRKRNVVNREVVNIYDGDYMGGQAELLGQAEITNDRRSWSFMDTTRRRRRRSDIYRRGRRRRRQ